MAVRKREGHVQVFVGGGLHEKLKTMAEQEHRTIANCVEYILIQYFKKKE